MESPIEAVSLQEELSTPFDQYLQWEWPPHIETVLRRLMWLWLVELAEPDEEPGSATQATGKRPGYLEWLIAVYPESPGAVLDKLADSAWPALQERVAENPQAWTTTLARLSLSPASQVRIAVAEHPDTPPAVLHMLSRDPCPDVRYAMAANASLAGDLLEILLGDENPYVAGRAASTVERLEPPERAARVSALAPLAPLSKARTG